MMVADTFQYIKEQIRSLDIFDIKRDLLKTKEFAKKFDGCNKILVFGTGGSSLGGKCLSNFKALYFGNESRVIFIENVDSRSFLNTIGRCDPDTTGIIVISKSGKTTEILMLFLTLVEIWKDFDYKSKAIAITELSKDNDLHVLAKTMEIPVVEYNPKIGGRFSVFSLVGLLPAVLDNVDVNSFINGAQRVLDNVLESKNSSECNLFTDIASMYKVFKSGEVNQHVLMSYSDLMEDFGKWFVQLIAESLGKTEQFGITPLRATGTVDQHSMLQLFLSGPSNKLFTFIIQKNNLHSPVISTNVNSKTIDLLKNHTIHDLMSAHQMETIALLKKKAFVRVLEFNEINIEAIGFLMMLSFIEVITIAKLSEINPFDQPAVENSKKLVLQRLKVI
jgi:glucose-6-phosphate isomerase